MHDASTVHLLPPRRFGGQPQVAIQVVLATSVVGLVSIPFVIAWGLSWVNP